MVSARAKKINGFSSTATSLHVLHDCTMDLLPCVATLFGVCISALYHATEQWPIVVVLAYTPLLAGSIKVASEARDAVDAVMWYGANSVVCAIAALLSLVLLLRQCRAWRLTGEEVLLLPTLVAHQ